jgi:hypothetical protein
MIYSTYDRGDLVRCQGIFKDSTGATIDPGQVKFKVKDPVGNTSEYIYGVDGSLARIAPGVYHADINAAISGNWFYRFEATGSGQSAGEARFFVRASNF